MPTKLNETFVKSLPVEPEQKQRHWDTEIKGFHILHSTSGSLTFYYRYRTTSGSSKDHKLGRYGDLTTTTARTLAKAKAGDVANGIDLQEQRKASRLSAKRKATQTLGSFIEQTYGPQLRGRTKTADKMLASMKRYFGPWYSLNMSNINEFLVKGWKVKEVKRGLSSGGVNRPIAYLRACLREAVRLGIIDKHPLENLRPLKEDKAKMVRYLSEAERTLMFQELRSRDTKSLAAKRLESGEAISLVPNGYSDHLHPIVILAINTGMRRGEILNLQWQDISFTSKTITIHGATSKSGTTRHISLNDNAIAALKKWQSTDTVGYVFKNKQTGQKLTTIHKGFKALLVSAGIDDFRFHDLRHHFASSLVMAGVDLNTVRELLGHSDLQMTQRYAHLSPDHRAAAVQLISRM